MHLSWIFSSWGLPGSWEGWGWAEQSPTGLWWGVNVRKNIWSCYKNDKFCRLVAKIVKLYKKERPKKNLWKNFKKMVKNWQKNAKNRQKSEADGHFFEKNGQKLGIFKIVLWTLSKNWLPFACRIGGVFLINFVQNKIILLINSLLLFFANFCASGRPL